MMTDQGGLGSLFAYLIHTPWCPNAKTLTFSDSGVLTFQLQQEIKDWSKSHTELSDQIKSLQKSKKDLEIAVIKIDYNIDVSSFSWIQL